MMPECNGFSCRWIQDRHDQDHWVCLTCGQERIIRKNDPVITFIIGVAIALSLTLIFGFHSSNQEAPTPNSETTTKHRFIPQSTENLETVISLDPKFQTSTPSNFNNIPPIPSDLLIFWFSFLFVQFLMFFNQKRR